MSYWKPRLKNLIGKYNDDVSEERVRELKDLKVIHVADFGKESCKLFSNCYIALQILHHSCLP